MEGQLSNAGKVLSHRGHLLHSRLPAARRAWLGWLHMDGHVAGLGAALRAPTSPALRSSTFRCLRYKYSAARASSTGLCSPSCNQHSAQSKG